jgi:hypothetical protein
METFFYTEAFHAMRVKKIRHKNSFRDNAAGGALACRANQAYGTTARNVSINLAEFPRVFPKGPTGHQPHGASRRRGRSAAAGGESRMRQA